MEMFNLTWYNDGIIFFFLSIIEDKHTQWFERTKGQENEAKTEN